MAKIRAEFPEATFQRVKKNPHGVWIKDEAAENYAPFSRQPPVDRGHRYGIR